MRISTTSFRKFFFILFFVGINSCDDSFLEITPNGVLDEEVLSTYQGIDALLIGAYSMLDGVSDQFDWYAGTSGWIYASIRGMDANLGSDAGDSSPIHALVRYAEDSTNVSLNVKWRSLYEGIARCNAAIRTAKKATLTGNISADQEQWFINQARALRGFYHFEAWRLWASMKDFNQSIPYVTEETDIGKVNNRVDARGWIIDDLLAGTLLPQNMGQVGRLNQSVCQVLLAKAYMQMLGDYNGALSLLSDVDSYGTNPVGQKFELEAKYGDVFDIEFRNGVEAVYTVQYSVNDGSGSWNGGWGEVLNFPYKEGGSPGGCCGFFQPTQDLVNSFRTDNAGLPFLDSYNSEKVTNDQGLLPSDPFIEYSGSLDPRLDWTVGRRGIPYWDWGVYTGKDWIRDQSYAGPYSSKKQVYKKSQEGIYTEVGSWTSGFTANGYRLIRFADVLLLKAECEAITGSDDLGLNEVNRVRARAANPEGFVMEADGSTPAANYLIGLYNSFINKEYALKAIRFERKLELGMEGHRYYDLQRWGLVQDELNRILEYEKTMEWGPSHYGNAIVGPEDVNYPIPQRQIDLSQGNLVQNR